MIAMISVISTHGLSLGPQRLAHISNGSPFLHERNPQAISTSIGLQDEGFGEVRKC